MEKGRLGTDADKMKLLADFHALWSPLALAANFLILMVGLALGLSWRSREIEQEIELRKKWEKTAKELIGFKKN